MQSMFDKLGDLLSKALEKGELPKSEKDSQNESFENPLSDFSFINKDSAKEEPDFQKKEQENPKKAYKFPASPQKKLLPESIKNALDFLGISDEADFDSAKKIYREKLMYYHPDRRNSNPVLQKVAKEKTERLLKEWSLLEKWYKEQKVQK